MERIFKPSWQRTPDGKPVSLPTESRVGARSLRLPQSASSSLADDATAPAPTDMPADIPTPDLAPAKTRGSRRPVGSA